MATAPRFAALLKSAPARLDDLLWRSGCAPTTSSMIRSGDRATHGAACHSCLLISETSCGAPEPVFGPQPTQSRQWPTTVPRYFLEIFRSEILVMPSARSG